MRALLYTWPGCSFCERAKSILERNRVPYREHCLYRDRPLLERLRQQFGVRTMPFVFLDGEAVGGLAELEELEARGELD